MFDAVEQFLRTSQPCLLCTYPDVRRLADVADELSSAYSWSHFSVGRELSGVLLSEVSPRRSLVANQWLRTRLTEFEPGPVLCTQIDLLFNPVFDLDPLRLFCHIGRVCRLVVAWPGSYRGHVLSYAVPEHSHYRIWRRPTAPIVALS